MSVSNSNTNTPSRLDLSQFILSGVIATIGLIFSWVTYSTENSRIEHDRKTVETRGVQIAIADMSKQLGLMAAQCPEGVELRTLGTDHYPSKLESGCYSAYLEARSLLYYTQVAVPPNNSVSGEEWDEIWDQFNQALVLSGTRGYVNRDLRTHWEKVIGASVMREHKTKNL